MPAPQGPSFSRWRSPWWVRPGWTQFAVGIRNRKILVDCVRLGLMALGWLLLNEVEEVGVELVGVGDVEAVACGGVLAVGGVGD